MVAYENSKSSFCTELWFLPGISMNTRAILFGLLSALLLLSTGCDKQSGSSAGEGSLEAKIDKHGDEVMASNAKAEARQWMKQPSHIFFKADPKQVAQFVEDFYGAGATQVLIADIEEHEGKQYGEALLVVLPKDATARAKIFQVNSRAETAFQDDSVSDKGQKYLYYSLD